MDIQEGMEGKRGLASGMATVVAKAASDQIIIIIVTIFIHF